METTLEPPNAAQARFENAVAPEQVATPEQPPAKFELKPFVRLVIPFTAQGLPDDKKMAYIKQAIATTEASLEAFGVGEALAEMGITSLDDAPPWLKAVLGIGLTGLTIMGIRSSYVADSDDSSRRADAAGDSEGAHAGDSATN